VKLTEALQNRTPVDVDDAEFSQQRFERPIGAMPDLESSIDAFAGFVVADEMDNDVGVEEKELGHDNSRSAPVISSSLSSPGQRPMIAFTPERGP